MTEHAPKSLEPSASITRLDEWRAELAAEKSERAKTENAYRTADADLKERTERHNDFRRYTIDYLNEHWFVILRDLRAEHARLNHLGIKRIWICPGPHSDIHEDDQMSAALFELFRNIPRPLSDSLPVYIQTTKEFLEKRAAAPHSNCGFLRLEIENGGGLCAFWD